MTYKSAVEAAWPTVAAVGRAELRRLRLPQEAVDDLLQEAAAVVMRRRPEFVSGDDLAPYVRIVVRRLGFRWLRERRREVVGTVPDRPVVHSVAEMAEHRLRLRKAAQAFASLPVPEQVQLRNYLIADAQAGDVRERARERKQIERIRTTISRIADGVAAALGWVRMRFRWLEGATPQVASVAFAVTGLTALLVPPMASPVAEPPMAASTSRPSGELSGRPSNGDAAQIAQQPSERPAVARRAAREPDVPEDPEARSTDVVRITAPGGADAGWRKDQNPTGDTLVCVRGPLLERTCVEEPTLLAP